MIFKNRRGQALVEFVLILPVLILILFTIVDFGNIISTKTSLENDSSDMVRMLLNGKNINDIESIYPDVMVEVNDYKNQYQKVSIQKNIPIVTPFLHGILGKNYEVVVERVIPYES